MCRCGGAECALKQHPWTSDIETLVNYQSSPEPARNSIFEQNLEAVAQAELDAIADASGIDAAKFTAKKGSQ